MIPLTLIQPTSFVSLIELPWMKMHGLGGWWERWVQTKTFFLKTPICCNNKKIDKSGFKATTCWFWTFGFGTDLWLYQKRHFSQIKQSNQVISVIHVWTTGPWWLVTTDTPLSAFIHDSMLIYSNYLGAAFSKLILFLFLLCFSVAQQVMHVVH